MRVGGPIRIRRMFLRRPLRDRLKEPIAADGGSTSMVSRSGKIIEGEKCGGGGAGKVGRTGGSRGWKSRVLGRMTCGLNEKLAE